jgi:hypothetical protein
MKTDCKAPDASLKKTNTSKINKFLYYVEKSFIVLEPLLPSVTTERIYALGIYWFC